MRRLAASALLALLALSPSAAHAVTDPGTAFGFAPASSSAPEEALPRAPGPAGQLRLVRARTQGAGLRVAILVEGSLPVRVQSFARAVGRVLHDPRGWRQAGYAFRSFRASPPT